MLLLLLMVVYDEDDKASVSADWSLRLRA